MKKLPLILLLLLEGPFCGAQTFDEWFRQKDTKKRYLIEQIAAFSSYLNYVQKGYAIAEKGLSAISKSKQGDFIIHRDFFDYLKGVNPNFNSYAKVADIVALQLKIIQVSKEVPRKANAEAEFNVKESDYIMGVFENILALSSDIIANLTVVVTARDLEMKDDERLKRIDALYNDMQEAFAFTQAFGSEIKLLSHQRKKERANVQASRTLHDVKMD